MITTEELATIKQIFGRPTALWIQAFKEYNDYSGNKKLSWNNCRSCYFKVFKWHEERIMQNEKD